MAKIDNSIKSPHYFNTLEVTSDYFKDKSHEKQYYKAFRKHKTLSKLTSIIDTIKDGRIKKRYWQTYHCNNIILQENNTFSGSLCRKRWCAECCRIKTAELTNGYKKPLLDIAQNNGLYFVTLTRPNVKGRELKSEIKKMIKGFQNIKDNLRKNYKIKLNGIRKIEVTYNEIENTYHPHFHFIQSDYKSAHALQSLWLKQFSNANIKGQDIREIDTTNENSFIELFKYATKETTKEGKQYSGEVLHTIYSSIEGLRIYQTYGSIKKIKAPKEIEIEINNLPFIEANFEIWKYDNKLIDWTLSNGTQMIETLKIKDELSLKQRIKSNKYQKLTPKIHRIN